MPGNVKLGSSNEPDPDPTPYLFVSNEQKRHEMTKPYDPKKSVWISDDEGGFHEGLLHSDDGKKAVVMVGHEVIVSFLLTLNLVKVAIIGMLQVKFARSRRPKDWISFSRMVVLSNF